MKISLESTDYIIIVMEVPNKIDKLPLAAIVLRVAESWDILLCTGRPISPFVQIVVGARQYKQE